MDEPLTDIELSYFAALIDGLLLIGEKVEQGRTCDDRTICAALTQYVQVRGKEIHAAHLALPDTFMDKKNTIRWTDDEVTAVAKELLRIQPDGKPVKMETLLRAQDLALPIDRRKPCYMNGALKRKISELSGKNGAPQTIPDIPVHLSSIGGAPGYKGIHRAVDPIPDMLDQMADEIIVACTDLTIKALKRAIENLEKR